MQGMGFAIRPYTPTDLPELYRVCLLTGDSGADASGLYHDPELLGHFYAAPYAVREPDLTFVLTDLEGVCGYVLGCRDSLEFAAWMEAVWLPPLRQKYPLPLEADTSRDAAMIRLIHKGYVLEPGRHLPGPPAHRPAAQGPGAGAGPQADGGVSGAPAPAGGARRAPGGGPAQCGRGGLL